MVDPAREDEVTYSLGAVSRLTGLSGHVLRAWERRHGAITPLRTAGGTRRYRESDLARLQLLRAAVEAGHPIGSVAPLSDAELRQRAEPRPGATPLPLRALFDAAARLDDTELQRLLELHLAALGARRFATQVAAPLLREVGTAWEAGRLEIAAEHLVSARVRSLLGEELQRRVPAPDAPAVLFATPEGERHELGALIGAVCAAETGVRVIFLGPDLPADEISQAALRAEARVVVLGLMARTGRDRGVDLAALRRALPRTCELWVGGPGVAGRALPRGVVGLADVEALETRLNALRA